MNLWPSYRFLKIGLNLGMGIALSAGIAMAQQMPKGITQEDIYCSGVVTDQAPAADSYVITGEDSNYRDSYSQGENVYLNRGADKGVKVGDEYEVIRPIHDPLSSPWFKWQTKLSEAMGTVYGDIGRVRVVSVLAKTSIATVRLACDMLQRGDIIRPFSERPIPAFQNTKFDPYAAPSGKKTAMIVMTKHFGQIAGAGRVVYVNLGSAQGVQVGNFFRVFHYQGTRNEVLYQVSGTAYKVFGFGSTPVAYEWNDLPRQVLGEGIVLRTGPNSSTVLITLSTEEVSAGDYVELE